MSKIKDIYTSAASLYDGGWRAKDKDQLIREYKLSEEDAEKTCAELKGMEKRGIKMKINFLYRRFDDNRILYAPNLRLSEAKSVAEECFPAVRVHPNFIDQSEYFLLLVSEIGEYQENIHHPEKGFFFKELGGREKIEKRFREMYEA